MRHHIVLVAAVITAGVGCSVSGEATVGDDGPVVIEDSRELFEDCEFDEQCPIDAACYEVAADYGDEIVTGDMCTWECLDDFDCTSDAICLGGTTGPALCYQTCVTDADCWPAFICVEDPSTDFIPVCQPG